VPNLNRTPPDPEKVREVLEEAHPEVFFTNPSHHRTSKILDQIL
jgi:hypothetical protein